MLISPRRGMVGAWLVVLASVVLAGVPAVAAGLPDGRGYELVSPAVKNGSDVMADSGRTRASVSGDAVDFASLGVFGDALGSGVSTDYISERTGIAGTSGWTTHAIMPRVSPLTVLALARGKDTIYQAEFSDDLSKGVLGSYTPLTNDDPNVTQVMNLYLRQDVLATGPGSYSLLSACPACTGPLTDPLGGYQLKVAGATPDLGHIIFEAGRDLTADAPPYPPFPASFCNVNPIIPFLSCDPRLYEWDHGTLRLAGILPDGSAAPISIAGQGATGHYTLNTISRDGSKVFFTVPSSSGDTSGDLYMRVNHTTTVKLNASERTDCADHDPCTGAPEPDPAGPQPALWATASPDGSKVFFSTNEQLTDTTGSDLYVYDTTLPVSDPNHLRHVYNDAQPDDGQNNIASGFVGTSQDGSYAYFLAPGAILPGQADLPAGTSFGVYVWHDAVVSFVGSIDADALGIDVVTKLWPGLAARVSPDGRTLLYDSQGELYRYRADTGTVSCVSCNPSGALTTLGATDIVNDGTGGTASASHLTHPLTDDGDHVFFETGERLLPQQDVNGTKTDVYEWTAAGASGCETSTQGYSSRDGGCLALISSGTSTDDSHFLDANPTGHDVFFTTDQQLVGWDTDTSYDLYDARIGGGLPNPPAPAPDCAGEACQGLISPPPTSPLPATSNVFHGSGNVPPATHTKKPAPKKCAKGKIRKRVHGKITCVKKPKPKPKKHTIKTTKHHT